MNTRLGGVGATGWVAGVMTGGLIVLQLGRGALIKNVDSVASSREIGLAGFCANGLGLLRDGEAENHAKLLESRLTDAIEEAERLTSDGARLEPASPNVREGLRRASEYDRTRHPDSDLGEWAQAVLAAQDERR